MSLPPGTRLGPYEVVGLIGEGGMGHVYRARDTKLGREVAVKILPDAFAADPNRTSRFDREARTLAQLNHPNIAQIYGVEERALGAGGPVLHALIMELVEGEDLSTQLNRGPLALPDSLDIARQIAVALEAAHDLGIVHRDLKPSNVKLASAGGVVKLLDFGLAKAIDEAGSSPNSGAGDSAASTMTSPAMTAMGMILGTAAYMSPEQARGKPTDKRTDIWAFGVVLYELFTGRRLFSGETVSDVMSAVLRQEIDFSPLPLSTPPEVRRLLTRCLDRDPQTRLRDIGEARVALSKPEGKNRKPEEEARSQKPDAWIWTTTALAIALVSMTALWWRRPAPAVPPVARFDVAPPNGATISISIRPPIGVSPDGSMYVVAATLDGVTRLYVRRRGATEPEVVPGTEGASNPVVSPDGKTIGFFADNALKTAVLDGPVAIAASGLNDPRGLTWLDPTTIVYAPGALDGLSRIHLGGAPETLTTLDTARNERTHRWPVAIAGGKAVAFTVGTMESPDDYENARIDAAMVATKERRPDVYKNASFVVGTIGEYLIAARGGSLHAIRFDAERLVTTGPPTAVVQGVAGDLTTGAVHAALAADGTLMYVTGDVRSGASRRLAWVDASGTMTTLPGLSENTYNDVRISPDGSKVALIIGNTGSGDVWVYEVARATLTRLSDTSVNGSPVWSSDGRTVYYSAVDASGRRTIFWRRAADGSREPEQVASIDGRAYLTAVEPNAVLVDYYGDKTDLLRVPMTHGAPTENIEKLVATPYDEYAGALSPNGRWLAYQSDESGHFEVYVRDLWPAGGRQHISNGFGEEPKWSADGRTLYYRADELLMAVPLEIGTTLVAGTPKLFFKGAFNLRTDTGLSYAVDRPRQRLLMIRPAVERQAPATLRVILNWTAELAGLVKR